MCLLVYISRTCLRLRLSLSLCCRWLDNKSEPPNIPGADAHSDRNKLWKQCFTVWCGKTNGHQSMERCNPKNTIIFYMESSECFEKVASFCVHRTHTKYVCLFLILSNKSKASIDEIVARLSDYCIWMYSLWNFLHSFGYSSFFSFYSDVRVKALDANQVDSISIDTPAHVLFSLFRRRGCCCCFLFV